MKKKSRSVSIIRLLREQQEWMEGKLEEKSRRLDECHQMFVNICTRLTFIEREMPDAKAVASDMRYLAEFCRQFWLDRDPATPMKDGEDEKFPAASREILARVPEERKQRFWIFLERLLSLVQIGRRG